MPVELNPNEHTLDGLFDYLKIEKFYIPIFQRPYAWGMEQCTKLWNDIDTSWGSDYRIPCFLGSIIVYPNTNKSPSSKHLYLIDGQQRVTTLLLLLRAMYTVVETNMNNAVSEELKDQFKDTMRELKRRLWKPEEPGDRYSKINQSVSRLSRENLGTATTDYFQIIMDTGLLGSIPKTTDDYSTSENTEIILKAYEYSKKKGPKKKFDTSLSVILQSNECLNYAYFLNQLYKIQSKDLPRFISLFLSKCYILPLITGDDASALLIFDTLNNRGMPLTVSDILKNKIAEYFRKEHPHDEFKSQWDNLLNVLKFDSDDIPPIPLDSLFKHYMYALRMTKARDSKDPYAKSKDPEVRDYFTSDKHGNVGTNSLKSPEVILMLTDMATFLVDVLSFTSDAQMPDSLIDMNTRYEISVLSKYSKNGKWQYLITTFWFCYRTLAKSDPKLFRKKFEKFIRFCASILYLKFIISDINDTVIPTLCESIAIQASNESYINRFSPSFALEALYNQDDFKEARKVLSVDNASNLDHIDHLVLLYAYSFKNNAKRQPILDTTTVEHIMPKTWQNAWCELNYRDKDEITRHVRCIGNLITMNRSKNSKASNKAFAAKLKDYRNTNGMTFELKKFVDRYPNNSRIYTWDFEDIEERNKKIVDYIIKYIRSGIKGGIA
ncbi:MAG: DUF262 domain-containing protein [Proteobacteria bacterium]|nr:DUF262 domain-containing protein [Pseudomonadota bacterium]